MNIFMKLLEGFFGMVVNMITGLLSFPLFPPEIGQAFAVVIDWMSAALGIVNFFLPISAVAPGLVFVMLVYAVEKVYHFVMWILRKLPFVGIE